MMGRDEKDQGQFSTHSISKTIFPKIICCEASIIFLIFQVFTII